MNSLDEVETDPGPAAGRPSSCCSATWPTVTRARCPGEYDRYNMKRQVSLTANIAGEDLGRRRRPGRPRRSPAPATPPKGPNVDVRGQIPPMQRDARAAWRSAWAWPSS